MADTPGTQPDPSAAVPAAAAPSTPAVAAPGPAPAAAPTPAAAPEPAAAPAEKPAAPELKRADAEPSLIETLGAKPPEPEKPAPEAPKSVEGDAKVPPEVKLETAEAAKPPEVSEAAKPAPLKYENFTLPDDVKLPDGVKLDDKRVAEVGAVLAEHQVPEPVARALLGQHVSAMNDFRAATLQNQHDVFANTRAEWRKQIQADPILGGAGHQTAMARVARMRDLFLTGKNEAETQSLRAQFNDFCRLTGAGDHPILHRLLYNAGARFDEPAPAPVPHNPAPDRGGQPKGTRRSKIYDHPTSTQNRNGAGR